MSAAAHTSLAHILLHEWQWQAAEQQFQRAIDLDPSYTLALHWYALCLTALGRTDEAVKAMQRAQQLDPLSVRINADLGMALLAAGKYEDAVAQEDRALELAPDAAALDGSAAWRSSNSGDSTTAEIDMKAALAPSRRHEPSRAHSAICTRFPGRPAEATDAADRTHEADGCTRTSRFSRRSSAQA